MAFPAPAYSRSNSQAALGNSNSNSNSSAPSGGQGQQNDQRPRMRSGSSLRQDAGSASSSGSFVGSLDAGQQSAAQFDEELADQLRTAHDDSRAISDAITSLTSANELDTDQLLALFDLIKKTQQNHSFEILRRESPATLTALGTRIASMLMRLSSEIDSGKFDTSPLNAEDIHQVCNALAAVVGDGPGQSIFLKQDLRRLHGPLQSITDAMLSHARAKNFIEKSWDNTQLLNVLNWLSRGLKQGVLSDKNVNLRQCFTSALKLMHSWAAAPSETTGPATQAARMDSRQLGKCMVQINTCIRFSLIDLDRDRDSLASLILRLCGGGALDSCTLWETTKHDAPQKHGLQRTLKTVVPESGAVTGVSNTIKDALAAGILDLGDSRLQEVISKLCRLMQKIPTSGLLSRGSQGLGNCCNFLREICEVQFSRPDCQLKDANTFELTCKQFLESIAQLAHSGTKNNLSEQATANLISFVKAMERTHAHQPRALKAAGISVLQSLSSLNKRMLSADSMGATLGGLQHLAQCHVLDPAKALTEMIALLGTLSPDMVLRWPERSRATLMRAVVYCSNNLSKDSPVTLRQQLAVIMQNLLTIRGSVDDRLPYLQAICILIEQHGQSLDQHQVALKLLLPSKTASLISLPAIEAEIKQLSARAPEVVALAEPSTIPEPEIKVKPKPTPPQPGPTQPAMTTEASATKLAVPGERRIVGDTRRIAPSTRLESSRRSLTNPSYAGLVTTITTTTTVTTTTTSTAPLQKATANAWLLPSRSAKSTSHAVGEGLLPASMPQVAVRGTPASPAQITKAVAQPNMKPSAQSGSRPANKANAKSDKRNPITSAKATNADKKKSVEQLASAAKAKSSATPAAEFFKLLKQDAPLSNEQQTKLAKMLIGNPSLQTLKDGKGKAARTGLFYALANPNTAAAGILGLFGNQDANTYAETLKAVFDEVLIVEREHVKGLKIWLGSQVAENFRQLKKFLADKYPAGDMQKKIARPFVEILEEYSLIAPAETHETFVESLKDSIGDSIDESSEEGEFDIRVIRQQVTSNSVNNSSALENEGKVQDQRMNMTNKSGATNQPVDNEGRNALMVAIENKSSSTVKGLLEMSAAKQMALAVGNDGKNAMMYAAMTGYAGALRQLIQMESADEQAMMVDDWKMNALMVAIVGNHEESALLLLDMDSAEHQAGVRDIRGINALMYATLRGNIRLVKRLLELENASDQAMVTDNQSGHNALAYALTAADNQIAEALLDLTTANEQVLSRDLIGANVLTLAAQDGKSHMIQSLLRLSNAEIQATGVDVYQRNALIYAASLGHVEVIRQLLSMKSGWAQAKHTDIYGWNSLMHAAAKGQSNVVEFLLSQPFADVLVAATDVNGNDVITNASSAGNLQIAARLLNFKNNLRPKNTVWA